MVQWRAEHEELYRYHNAVMIANTSLNQYNRYSDPALVCLLSASRVSIVEILPYISAYYTLPSPLYAWYAKYM